MGGFGIPGLGDGIYSMKDTAEVIRSIPFKTSKPDMTVLSIHIGREKLMSRWLDGLKKIDYPKSKMHLLWICPSRDKKFRAKLKKEFNALSGYHSKTLVITDDLSVQAYSTRKVMNWTRRNQLITDTYNFARGYVGPSDYVFLLEDDVVVPKDCLSKMLPQFKNTRIGAICGRLLYRPEGSHRGKPLAWDIHKIYSINGTAEQSYEISWMEKQEGGVEEIGSGTFGCTLIRGDVFRRVHMVNTLKEIMGPDTCYGEILRGMGYKHLIDWSIHCDHMNYVNKKLEVYV